MLVGSAGIGASGGAQAQRNDEPRTAAMNPLIASSFCPRRAVGWRSLVTLVVAILRVLPGVAKHITQAKAVGLEAACRRRIGITIIAWYPWEHGLAPDPLRRLVPSVAVSAQVLFVVTKPEARIATRRGACAGCIFEFRLRQQPVRPLHLFRQPRHIGFRIIPAHTHHRVRALLRKAGIAPGMAELLPRIFSVGFAG